MYLSTEEYGRADDATVAPNNPVCYVRAKLGRLADDRHVWCSPPSTCARHLHSPHTLGWPLRSGVLGAHALIGRAHATDG